MSRKKFRPWDKTWGYNWEETKKIQERYNFDLDLKTGKCLALCKSKDEVNKLVLIKKEDCTIHTGVLETKMYEVDIIQFEPRGFSRRTGFINWEIMENYKHVIEIDAQRFFRLDKQIGMINALSNALQADILKSI